MREFDEERVHKNNIDTLVESFPGAPKNIINHIYSNVMTANNEGRKIKIYSPIFVMRRVRGILEEKGYDYIRE